MTKALSFTEFAEIINFVKAKRSFGTRDYKYPCVKYIDPVFDMRTNTVFSINFRGGSNKGFSCINDERFLTETMYERIMLWLNTEVS